MSWEPVEKCRGSALECAAILDVLVLLDVAERAQADRGKDLPARIVAMFTKLCR